MKVYRIDRAVWGKIQAALFTFGRFCDIIKAVRKLIDKLEFDEVKHEKNIFVSSFNAR